MATTGPHLPNPVQLPGPPPRCRTQSIADYVARSSKVVTLVDLVRRGRGVGGVAV
jgi:hypothetical protein